MGKITIVQDHAHDWEVASIDWTGKYAEGDAGLRFKRLLPGGVAAMPNMQRTQYHAGHVEPPHSHPEDEILFVLDGEVRMGQRVLTRGDALHIPRDTVYTLRTGETGAEFLRIGFGELSAGGGA